MHFNSNIEVQTVNQIETLECAFATFLSDTSLNLQVSLGRQYSWIYICSHSFQHPSFAKFRDLAYSQIKITAPL